MFEFYYQFIKCGEEKGYGAPDSAWSEKMSTVSG